MNVWKTLFILTLMLLLTAIFFVFNNNSKNSSLVPEEHTVGYLQHDKSVFLETILKQMIAYQNLDIKNVQVIGDKGSFIPIEEYKKNENLLFVLFYPQHYCGECFSADMERYNAIAKEFPQKTVVFSTQLDKRMLHFFKEDHQIESPLFQIFTDQVELFQEMHEPCFFLIEKDLKVNLFFNPDPEQPDMTIWYMDKIKSLLTK